MAPDTVIALENDVGALVDGETVVLIVNKAVFDGQVGDRC